MTDMTPAPEPKLLGENAADQADFSIGVADKDGRVLVRFNSMVRWFDLAPQQAIGLAEMLINSAYKARESDMASKGLVMPKPNRADRRKAAAQGKH